MLAIDGRLDGVRRRTTAGVLQRLGVAASAIGDELFIDGVVAECLAVLHAPEPIALPARKRGRPMTATVVRAIAEELRRDARWVEPGRIDALEEALRQLASADVASLRRPAVRADQLDIMIERHVAALANEDKMTGEHSRAVASWSRRIAERLGMSRSEVTFAGRCGLIHDVGKRNTPKEILQAARPLTDDEWHQMRLHVLDGFEIVKHDPLLSSFALAVRNHHERFDGGGYPDGLSGHDIPLVVRIVSVADAFNAMVAPRPYRASFSPTHAIDELAWHRGSQFDPTVVDAMIDVILSPGEEP